MTAGLVLLDRTLGMELHGVYSAARQGAFLAAARVPPPSGGLVITFSESVEPVSSSSLLQVPSSKDQCANLSGAVLDAQQRMFGKRGRLVTFSTFGPITHFDWPEKVPPVHPERFVSAPDQAVRATVETIRLAAVNGLVIDAFCFQTEPLLSTPEVLSAATDTGGTVTTVSKDDCGAIVADYLDAWA
jgi:hypothetical protein